MKEHDNDYSVIVYLKDQKTPKKWTYVNKLNGFALFLANKHPAWAYMNIYDRRNRKFLKQLKNGDFVPAFL